MRILGALFCGTLFGAGLAVSGMINPEKVLAFLDVAAIATNSWDPSLALVMLGGLIVATPFFIWAKTHSNALLGGTVSLPTKRTLDRPLIMGSLLFGVGWGLVGLCPGPAISALSQLQIKSLVFVLAMLSGMALHRGFLRK
ncbi:DUF6691 family protein [uncultured Thalassospira sp.]|jgi:uncharacterized membrane protein YedE/YeeE|uniref:DUF6691 family protein n=1 Tax=uncultured Thalassospira sp. TaxID=404382 RepID=UPI0030D87F49|tara:strand:+ start:2989 stop:3411 length:423 start_codon:yes stop_codon:yes gene_type:complete